MRHGLISRALAIALHIFRFTGDTERTPIETRQAAEQTWNDAPNHHVVGKIGDAVPKRGQFPIQQCDSAGLRCVEDHVINAQITMENSDWLLGWSIFR